MGGVWGGSGQQFMITSGVGTADFKNTLHGGWGQGPGSVDPRFPAGLPFPVPEIQEFVAFRDSGKIFQQFSRDFPGP